MTPLQSRLYETAVRRGHPGRLSHFTVGEVIEAMGFAWPEDNDPNPAKAVPIVPVYVVPVDVAPVTSTEDDTPSLADVSAEALSEDESAGTSITALNLTPAVISALRKAGIVTIERIEATADLEGLPKIGAAKADRIRAAVKGYRAAQVK